MSKGLSRELWTTRDLQLAAAAGALLEGFESEEDDVEVDGVDVDEEDVVEEAAAALFEEVERLSVR